MVTVTGNNTGPSRYEIQNNFFQPSWTATLGLGFPLKLESHERWNNRRRNNLSHTNVKRPLIISNRIRWWTIWIAWFLYTNSWNNRKNELIKNGEGGGFQPINNERLLSGAFYNLYNLLRADNAKCFYYFSMSQSTFDDLFNNIKSKIMHKKYLVLHPFWNDNLYA